MPELSWKARRHGDVYCAPACGCNCRYSEYVKACLGAERLAARLTNKLGKKWRPRVWENMGWHFEAVSWRGCIQVKEDHKWPDRRFSHPTFTAYVRNFPGNALFTGEGKTPEAAVEDARAEARRQMEGIAVWLKDGVRR